VEGRTLRQLFLSLRTIEVSPSLWLFCSLVILQSPQRPPRQCNGPFQKRVFRWRATADGCFVLSTVFLLSLLDDNVNYSYQLATPYWAFSRVNSSVSADPPIWRARTSTQCRQAEKYAIVSQNIWRHYSRIGGRRENVSSWQLTKRPLHMSEKVEADPPIRGSAECVESIGWSWLWLPSHCRECEWCATTVGWLEPGCLRFLSCPWWVGLKSELCSLAMVCNMMLIVLRNKSFRFLSYPRISYRCKRRVRFS
jgi:hypothetical protein